MKKNQSSSRRTSLDSTISSSGRKHKKNARKPKVNTTTNKIPYTFEESDWTDSEEDENDKENTQGINHSDPTAQAKQLRRKRRSGVPTKKTSTTASESAKRQKLKGLNFGRPVLEQVSQR